MPAAGSEYSGLSDGDLLRSVGAGGLDALLTLDYHRQPEVWAELLLDIADGSGRLVRLKPGPRDGASVLSLTRVWVKGYEKLEAFLKDPAIGLVQVGREWTSSRSIPGGVRGYTRLQVARLTQQEMHIAPDNTLRTPGRPRLRD